MYVIHNNRWEGPFLDTEEGPGSIRLIPQIWISVEGIDDQYIDFSKSKDKWRRVFDYIRMIGLKNTLVKIWSRRSEALRNRKYIGIGIGFREESPEKLYLFFSYNHPEFASSIVISKAFVIPWPEAIPTSSQPFLFFRYPISIPPELYSLKSWSPFSGISLDEQKTEKALRHLVPEIKGFLSKNPTPITVSNSLKPNHSPVFGTPPVSTKRKSAVVLGYGNYAKTMVIPYLKPHLDVVKVHDIDPLQIGKVPQNFGLDSSPLPKDNENFDAYIASGFHHTHVDIACHAFKKGAYAIVEKPLCTTFTEFERFEEARLKYNGRFFLSFQRRYFLFNDFIREDLGSGPLHFRCMVYEVRLPRKHWYNWPNSKSRIVSNACHWVDHFMYLNHFSPASAWRAQKLKNDDYLISIELENTATFEMILSDHGSPRLGVRELIEIATSDRCARIFDSSHYESESSSKILRSKHGFNKYLPLRMMYDAIGKKIVEGHPGDSPESLSSTRVMLRLEEELENAS